MAMRRMKASMKKGMKKSMKKAAMKGMRRRAMKVSKIAKGKRGKSSVFRGTKVKTSGGLQKSDLIRNKRGKVVSKKASAQGKRRYQKNGLGKWTAAVQKACKALGIRGFQAVGGKTKRGQELLRKARSFAK